MSSHSVDIQNTQVYLKNTSCNTFPIVCASCGSNDYFQTFPPISCLYPCISRLKDSANFCEDGFSIRQPILSSPPLLQPLFQNNLIPANVFYENASKKIDSNITKNELGGIKEDESSTKTDLKSNSFKNISSSGRMISNKYFSNNSINSCNIQKSDSESSTTPCACRNDISWGYSPIIVPIIPYYLIWNPKCSDIKHVSTTNNDEKAKETKKDNKTKENVNLTESKPKSDFNYDIKSSLPKDDKMVQEECLLDNKTTHSHWISKDTKPDSSSSLFSLSSFDCGEENIFFGGDKIISNKNSFFHDSGIEKNVIFDLSNIENISKKETKVEIETKMTESEKNECDESHSNFCLSSSLTIENDLESVNTKSNNNQPPEISSSPEILFKTKNPDTNDLSVEITKAPDQEADLEHKTKNKADFLNNSEKLNKERELKDGTKTKIENILNTKFEDKTTNKKCYKNFTMSDLSKPKIRDEIKIFDAAAGDLGNGSSSYRIMITPSTSEQLGENLQKSISGQSSQKDLESKQQILIVSNENKNTILDKKENNKEQRIFKSAIAKFSNNFKIKELKSNELEKKELRNKDPKPKVQTINKRKITSIPTKSATENNENLKTQKIRRDQLAQNQIQGLEKQNMGSKAAQEKEKLFKRDDKRKPTKINL